jgi:DNA-binding CsgD family transcriptional regulator
MHKNLKRSRDIAYLRQLCCSGLPKEALICEFLVAVKQVLPSQASAFVDVEKQFSPADMIYDENFNDFPELPQIVIDYWIPIRIFRFASWFAKHPVLTNPNVFDENFNKSELYNLGFRRYNNHHTVTASVIHLGKPIGMVSLHSPKSGNPYDHQEQVTLVRLMPYLSHALNTPPSQDITYSDNGELGMMIMDNQGAMLFQSQIAKKLLNIASCPIITADAARQKSALVVKLAQLCRNLDTIFKSGEAAPPSFCHVNGRGRFIFRAQWLDSENREQGRLIGVTIEHQEPLLLKILRALQPLPLSPVQKEIAVMLAQGQSNETIGTALHIKLTTVKDHCRKIYTKLDIENREQLLPKLLATEKERQMQLNW